MLDGDALEAVVKTHQPALIVPEVEAIRTEKLLELEAKGYTVIPTAAATNFTMNRDRIRDLASHELGLRTAKSAYANSLVELKTVAAEIGFPNVIKPVTFPYKRLTSPTNREVECLGFPVPFHKRSYLSECDHVRR